MAQLSVTSGSPGARKKRMNRWLGHCSVVGGRVLGRMVGLLVGRVVGRRVGGAVGRPVGGGGVGWELWQIGQLR